MSLSAYFEKHATFQESNYYSHVSMELQKKYMFEHDKLETMWTTYCQGIMNGEPAYYQERMLECCTLRGDFDLKIKKEDAKKFKISTDKNFYTEEELMSLVKMFFVAIQKTLQQVRADQLVCFVLEKPAPVETDTHIKCGFHIEFPFILLNKEDLSVILYPKLVSLYEEYDVFMRFGDYAKSFFDSHILSNAWLMYGSKKSPSAKSYTLSKIFDSQLTSLSLEKVMESRKLLDTNEQEMKIDQPLQFYLPRILSTMYLGKKHYICRAKPQDLTLAKSTFKKLKEPEKNSQKIQPTTPEERVKEARELMPFLSETRADDYHMWMKIGWLLYNIGEGSQDALQLWIDFSKRTTKGNFSETKCIFEWGKMKADPEGLTLGTLRYYANEDSPEEYGKYCRSRSKNIILQSIEKNNTLTPTIAAQALWQHYKSEFVYTQNKMWYYFRDHRWNFTPDGIELRKKICDLIAPIQDKITSIRTEIRSIDEKIRDQEEDAMSDDEDKEAKRYSDKDKQNLDKFRLLLIREKNFLEDTTKKDKIIRECRELFLDTEFEAKLDSNVNLMGFANGVLDLKEGGFRDGRPDDYISMSTGYDFRMVEDNSPEMADVDDYLLKVFPDPEIREYFIDQACILLRGGNLQKKVMIYSNSTGDNSKSVCIELIQNTLGEYAIELPTTLLTQKAAQSSQATPELMSTKGKRFAVCQEPGPRDSINMGMLKLLSGNDKISGRQLYQTQSVMKPQFKLAIICNKLPRVECDDQATWNRLRVIPFESRFINPQECALTLEEQLKRKEFPRDPLFNIKLPGMKYAFMTKLFKRYLEAEKQGFPIIEPEKVVCETKKYRSANDVYANYLSDQTISDPESPGIMLNDLYEQFKGWFKSNYTTSSIPPKHEMKEYLSNRYSKFFIVNRLIGFRYRNEEDDEEMANAEFERIQRERMEIRQAREDAMSQGN